MRSIIDDLDDQINGMEKVAKVALAQLWLPFEKTYGEPLHPGFYIVTKQQKTGEKQVAMAHWDGTEWSGNGNFQNVTAFMFAPDPWEGLDD